MADSGLISDFWLALVRFVAEAYPQTTTNDINVAEQYFRQVNEHAQTVSVMMSHAIEVAYEAPRPREVRDFVSLACAVLAHVLALRQRFETQIRQLLAGHYMHPVNARPTNVTANNF